jgi:lysozyme
MTFTLRRGDAGQQVRRLQIALGCTVDGSFGPATEAALRSFQAAHGLTADGIAGPATLAALGTAPLAGIDVSHWQRQVDWRQVAAQGIRFAFAKATQGVGGVDPCWRQNRADAAAAGVPLGAYHFAVPQDHAAIDEADWCLRTVGQPSATELPIALDLEAYADGLSPAALCQWADTWLSRVHACTGRTPILYTGTSFLQHQLGGGHGLEHWPLWIARYRGAADIDPGPVGAWSDWTIWQYASSETRAGVDGHVDTDWLAGGEPALQRLLGT